MIRLDLKGPIFFRQKRVGQNGIEFEMLKFRSMYHNSDDALHRKAMRQFMNGDTLSHKEDSSKRYKLTNDSRVTRVGSFLRKTSIDELPQFFNVLRGHMTLVGPRPALQYEVELYSPPGSPAPEWKARLNWPMAGIWTKQSLLPEDGPDGY